jgi:hypothetical protein
VVLIVVDTLRADPRGVRFTQATAQSSWTAASMVSLMLSRHLAADFVRMPEGRPRPGCRPTRTTRRAAPDRTSGPPRDEPIR